MTDQFLRERFVESTEKVLRVQYITTFLLLSLVSLRSLSSNITMLIEGQKSHDCLLEQALL